tara:strand:- start:5079 stop:6989 length:1911 start_codon:yes stop_codon:yes gene_type:complete
MAEAYQKVLLGEDNMALLKKAAGGSAQKLKMKDGKVTMDSFTASAIMQIYKAVNAKNKKTMENLVNTGNKAAILKLQKFAMSKINSGDEVEHDGEELDEAVKVGDTVKVKLNRKGKEYIEKGKVTKIEKDSIIVKHDFSRTPSRVSMKNIVKEEVELDEATINLANHDATDKDFQKLVKKNKLKIKSSGDETVVTGDSKGIEKMLQTMYGNDWKDMYKVKGGNYIEIDEMAYKPGKMKDTKPQERGAKEFDKLIKNGGMDKKDFQKARQLYVQASDAASREKLKKFIYNLDTEPTEAIMDLIGRNDPDTFNKMYPKSKPGEYLSSISFNHRNVKAEETELDENEGLKNKAKKTGMPYGVLKKVYDRGMAAYKTGHRPGTTPQQWAMARVNSFTTKSKGTWGGADKDLAAKVREETELDEASARRDAMRAMRKGKEVDPADIDTDATDDDVKAASKNIMMQMRKVISLRGNFKVEFGDKKKEKVDPKIAQAVLRKYDSMRKPMDKEKFQAKIGKSYKDLLSALKENFNEDSDEMKKVKDDKFSDRIKNARAEVRASKSGTQAHSDAIDKLDNAKQAMADYKKKTASGKLKSAAKKAAVAGAIGAIATAKLGDSFDPTIKRETILDRIDKKIQEKKNG